MFAQKSTETSKAQINLLYAGFAYIFYSPITDVEYVMLIQPTENS